jgi:SagB-type dehydrogenase family enzyme
MHAAKGNTFDMTTPPPDAALEKTLLYHEETKHHLERYARSLGYLEWADQPNPFREFLGAPRVELPLAREEESPPFAELFSGQPRTSQALTRRTLGLFFELSLALSAWKETPGARWALRINPSSGNLHPTEAYALLPAVEGISAHGGAYHYLSRDHALELRCRWEEAAALGGFYLALTSIPWREAWKYGERAFRYCQHDLGHALAAVSFSAATLGWKARLQTGSPGYITWLLGLDQPAQPLEPEIPEALVWIQTGPPQPPFPLPASHSALQWFGQPNQLSKGHTEWPLIDEVAAATSQPSAPNLTPAPPGLRWPESRPLPCLQPAGRIIRQRRSAVAFDGTTPLPRASFLQMLDLTLPRPQVPPFDLWDIPVSVHLVLFVHRVTELEPGLYLWVRDLQQLDALRAAFRPDFLWQCEQPQECPLFALERADLRKFAKTLSCHQDIAADGAFSLGMLTQFEPALRARGPQAYRQFFWETGMIGQSLYLGAEAAGMRATGIGCYFDDVLHHALGLKDRAWQSLYHFTIGTPVDDPRLRSAPPYGEERTVK